MSTTAVLESVGNKPLDDLPLFEMVDGQKVEMPPMSYFATLLGTRLVCELGFFLKHHNLGHAANETIFHLPSPVNRNRRPDLAFVSYARWPKDREKDKVKNAWDVVPNIIGEIVSPNDDAKELMDKLDDYFKVGVEIVWVIYPELAMVYVYESLTQVHGLTRNDTLDGGKVLQQFQLPLKDLFID
jgi:Uma2 family endonuclease